jgi:hypothetical protein
MKIPNTVSHFGQIDSAHVEVRGICEGCVSKNQASQEQATP